MIFKKRIPLILITLFIGALGGYAYYHFVGCASGTCPITSNPYISTSYGAVFGLALGFSFSKNSKKQ